LAKERGLELPARLLRNSDETDANGPVIRTVYKLGGTPTAPEVIPVVIKVGITDGSATEVIEGLEEGEAVITSAYLPTAASGTANPFGGSTPRR
jgi:HlyD family secretion protein